MKIGQIDRRKSNTSKTCLKIYKVFPYFKLIVSPVAKIYNISKRQEVELSSMPQQEIFHDFVSFCFKFLMHEEGLSVKNA